jgi:hypothetical protein
MPEVLDKLDVCSEVLKDLLLLNLKESVDARGKEHVCAIWLAVETGFLKHD